MNKNKILESLIAFKVEREKVAEGA